MSQRPTFIDLGLPPSDSSFRPPRLSPRVQYSDGERPPMLSPLDAFAAQSRMMSKQLDLEKVGEKRVSRLDPVLVTKSLSQHRADRPTAFRSLSGESDASQPKEAEASANTLTIEHPPDRRFSHRPRISGVPPVDSQETDAQVELKHPAKEAAVGSLHKQPFAQPDYFGLSRSESPAPSLDLINSRTAPAEFDPRPYLTWPISSSCQPTPLQEGAPNTYSNVITALPPPITSPIHHESSDDDRTGSITSSSFSYSRKLSASSGISAPHSPLSPFLIVRPNRSPSVASEASANGVSATRVPLNFSRPRSTASPSILLQPDPLAPLPSTKTRHPEPSMFAQRSQCSSPRPEESDTRDGEAEADGGGLSYTYAKYSLPRGRAVSRDSKIFLGLSTPHFEWKEPLFENTPGATVASNPAPRPSTTSPPRPSLDPIPSQRESPGKKHLFYHRPSRPSTPDHSTRAQQSASPSQSLKSMKSITSSKTSKSLDVFDARSTSVPSTIMDEVDDVKSVSSASACTLRPTSARSGAGTPPGRRSMAPEEHVRKAIKCHENGYLMESTYHLRIAAMQNHPTAMVLYALACRHGWGMRPNPREGVQWLRKALDSVSLEIREDDNLTSTLGPREIQDQQSRRTQFALSLYELGVSHLNGWGIEQDKALALRCFEMAGQWGDVDALTEAGFCYTEGVGCKKDLKKAAKLYRIAERRGASMVGNSWIYKDKYNDPETTRPRALARSTTASPNARSKSRTRSIFTRKKSHQPT